MMRAMNCTPTAQVDTVGSDSLIGAWLKQEESIRPFWPFPSSFQGIQDRLAHTQGINMERRFLVSDVLERQYLAAAIPIPEELQSFRSGARAVTTGHQLVLMGGPAFFHYKILSAIRWAKALSDQGIAAVPVFWLASEDHDFEEIAKVFSTGDEAFHWHPKEDPKGKAVGRLMWTQEDEKALAHWANTAGVLPMQVNHSFNSMPLAQRVRMWVHEMFAEQGVLVIDGDDPELKKAASHLWNAEWNGGGIADSVQASTAALEAAGWKAQLSPQPNNVFHLNEAGQRTRSDRWLDNNGATSWEAVSAEKWSPNAALRPLYQEFLLESAAVIGGPGEVAYWLQLRRAFDHHKIELPALMLRDGALVWSTEQATLAQAVEWSPARGMWKGAEASAFWVSMQMEPEDEVQQAWSEWGKALEAHANGMGREVVPTTLAALKQMEKEWLRLKKKWRKSVRARHAERCLDLEHLFDAVLFPHANPQERVVNARGLAGDAESLKAWNRLWLQQVEGGIDPQFLIFQSLLKLDVGD